MATDLALASYLVPPTVTEPAVVKVLILPVTFSARAMDWMPSSPDFLE